MNAPDAGPSRTMPTNSSSSCIDAGKISCCPERKMLPAYLTSGERSPDHDTLSEAYNLALADAAEKVGEILGADEWGEDGYHLGVSIRDLKKPISLPAISLDEIGALFFECGGVPVAGGVDKLIITPVALNNFGTRLVLRAEARGMARAKSEKPA